MEKGDYATGTGAQLRPRLIEVSRPADPSGLVLVLHGGARRQESMMVSPAQLSVLRMKPIARRIARVGHGRLAVFRLLNSYRGWDVHHTPVEDATWGLERARERLGREVPAALVGHSLGGRAALLAAGLPGVASVVALAAWVYPSDIAEGVEGRRILFVHGTADRTASPCRARQLADALSVRAEVSFVEVRGGRHAMLAHYRAFDGLAAQFVALTLLGDSRDPTMRRIAAGERRLRL